MALGSGAPTAKPELPRSPYRKYGTMFSVRVFDVEPAKFHQHTADCRSTGDIGANVEGIPPTPTSAPSGPAMMANRMVYVGATWSRKLITSSSTMRRLSEHTSQPECMTWSVAWIGERKDFEYASGRLMCLVMRDQKREKGYSVNQHLVHSVSDAR